MKAKRLRGLAVAQLAVATTLAAGGCSGYRDPLVTVRSASVSDVTPQAMALDIDVDLINPNNEPLELLNFNYDVAVNGVRAYSGVWSAQATLAANSQRHVRIPAVLHFDQLDWTRESAPSSAHYAVSGTLQYVTPGEIAQILLDTGVRKPRARVSGSGEMPLQLQVAP